MSDLGLAIQARFELAVVVVVMVAVVNFVKINHNLTSLANFHVHEGIQAHELHSWPIFWS